MDATLTPHDAARRYLDLLQRCLTQEVFAEQAGGRRVLRAKGWKRRPAKAASAAARRLGPEISMVVPAEDGDARAEGRDWPASADTMIGTKRMANLRTCVESVIEEEVPGDLIETGVWRGGATIMMRGILAAHGITDRTVFVADSFQGLPPPDVERFPQDEGDTHHAHSDFLGVSVEEVKRRFRNYDLLDDQVSFVVGWFADTLRSIPSSEFAVIRLDGDMYGSTMDALDALYPKLQPGGYCIIDDYGAVKGCRQAVEDYREAHDIAEPIEPIDWTGVFWRRA